jgi:GT2 family glycosyltransferase/tetratricopeptide (TPR) repeat protein
MIFFSKRRLGQLNRRGDQAMGRSDWAAASVAYAAIVKAQPQNHEIHVQHGHACKEAGDLSTAEMAYRSAIAIRPDDTETMLHLAHLLKRKGERRQALSSFAEILAIDPDNREAYAELVHGGGRNLLPVAFHRDNQATKLSGVSAAAGAAVAAIEDWREAAIYPSLRYDAFRHDFPIKPPPGALAEPEIRVVIDAEETSAAFLRATLMSLLDQVGVAWQAVIVASSEILDHPLASMAAADGRFRFVAAAEPMTGIYYQLHLSAGTILDRHALAWFAFTADRTSALAVWCDHDHAVEHWRDRPRYEHPILWGVIDPDLLAQVVNPPAAVLVHSSLLATDHAEMAAERRRSLMLRAAARQSSAHIPRLLASVLRIPERAEIAPIGDDFPDLWSADPRGSPPRPGPVREWPLTIMERGQRPAVAIAPMIRPDERIHIIIPTRDESRMLETAVASLLDMAARRERIAITIVDNRSRQPETAAAFVRLQAQAGVDVLPLDEPFNWSRANNVAAARSGAENIVFANNDIEMLTPGWDDILLGFLQREDVGLVGTRLLYPDGKLQHAAMLFGTGEGSPVHDGQHADGRTTGPQDRFDLTHAAVAVTGAFMAVTRDIFDQIGGFDALRLPVGYNDIDFCLRVRTLGQKILYTPAIELIHHESKTRGMNDTRARVALDQGELASMHARWGGALTGDPGYNLHWTHQHVYGGFREPTMREILDHIDLGGMENPWLLSFQNNP